MSVANPPELWNGQTPYAHQLLGAEILKCNSRWCLAWEMGTGKSAVVANVISYTLELSLQRVVIVCPKSAMDVWPEQLHKFGGLICHTYAGPPAKRKQMIARRLRDSEAWILVVGYEVARIDAKALAALHADCVILDEAHRIKDLSSKTNRAMRRIAQAANYRWALTGTPAPNSPLDVCGIMAVISPATLGTVSKTAIRRRYEIHGNPYIPQMVTGYQDLDDLRRRWGKVSHTLTKEECLDLPPKTFIERHCELSGEQARIYREIRDESVAELRSKQREGLLTVNNVLTVSLRLLQAVGGFVPDDEGHMHPVGVAKIELLKDVLADTGTEKAIIWTSFVEEARDISYRINARLHHGGMSTKDRRASIESWRTEDQWLVSTAASLREAVTLTEASIVIYYSRSWNSLDWTQSQDRAHRIGQDKPVTVISLVARGTIDEKVSKALAAKKRLQDLVSGVTDVGDLF